VPTDRSAPAVTESSDFEAIGRTVVGDAARLVSGATAAVTTVATGAMVFRGVATGNEAALAGWAKAAHIASPAITPPAPTPRKKAGRRTFRCRPFGSSLRSAAVGSVVTTGQEDYGK